MDAIVYDIPVFKVTVVANSKIKSDMKIKSALFKDNETRYSEIEII